MFSGAQLSQGSRACLSVIVNIKVYNFQHVQTVSGSNSAEESLEVKHN